ncbi:MAG: acyl-CoA dehydrogenase family protein [Myxococcota bacterium]|nr:acyl-CoA dehydrogenase family protein [Myxococcota bacterium]
MAIFPFELEEELTIFREQCLKFTSQHIADHAVEWEEAGQFPRALYREAADAGILGAGLPESLGGSGGDLLYPFVAAEAMLTAGSTGVIVGLQSMGIAIPPILTLGTEAQQQRFIPSTLRGETIMALAVTEPGAGSDVAGLKTTAVRDGDDYILNGSKLFITSGVRADYVVTLARTGPERHAGLTFFVVEKGMPGFKASRALKKTGWWASDTAELVYDNVRVPARNRLGDEGSGFVAVMQNFVTERLMLAFLGHATAEIALADALAYARQRQIFGQAVTEFQVNRHKIAKMATQVDVAKTYNYALALRVRAGERPVGEVAMAKNFAGEVAIQVCYEAVQLMGGMGYMRESRVERLSRDARLLPIGGGTAEVMNEVIARWAVKI